MSEVSQEEMDAVDDLLRDLDPLRGWIVAKIVCRICNGWHIAVLPSDVEDDEALECSRCHGMTGEVVKWYPLLPLEEQ